MKPGWSLRQARAPLIVFLIALVATSFLPLILLRKGGGVIGHLPVYLAYFNLRGPIWPYIGLHLLLSILTTALCILIWRVRHFRFNPLRFSLRLLFVAVALFALLLISGLKLYESYYAIPTVPLADAVTSFNAKYGNDPVGKYEPPITEAEIVAAISSAINLKLPSLDASPKAKAIYFKIVQTKRVPQDARLYAMNGWELKDGTSYTVWWINIDVSIGKNAGFGLRVRENNAPIAKPKGEPKLNLPDQIWIPKSPQ